MSGNEARTESLYRKLRQLFDEISGRRDHPLRNPSQRGELIGVVIREHEGYCGIMPRWGNETQKQLIERFGEKDVAIYAAGLVTKEMRGLVDLITRFDVELSWKEAEIVEKDEQNAGLVALLDATLRNKLDDERLAKLATLVDDALLTREIALREAVESKDAALALKDEELHEAQHSLEREREDMRQALDKVDALVDALTLRIEKCEASKGTGNDNGAVA
jgi:hypothetical protein